MTAGWVDDLGVGDAAVAIELTERGRAVVSTWNTLTTREAAAVAGVARTRVLGWVSEGALSGVKVDGRWLFDRGEVLACRAAMIARLRRGNPLRAPRVDAEPLLRHIELRGGNAALGVRGHSAEEKAIERARAEGSLTVYAADRLAVALLGLTPWELWGADHLTA